MDQQYQQPVAQVPPPASTTIAQAPVSTGPGFPNIVITSPMWVMALRIVQIVVSIIVLGCCAYLIHGAYADPQGFAIACVSPRPPPMPDPPRERRGRSNANTTSPSLLG